MNSVLRIERGKVVSALSVVQSIVERRNINPILSHVKVVVHPSGTMRFICTDMDVVVSSIINVEAIGIVQSRIAFTTPVSVFYEILRKMQEQYIDLDLSNAENGLLVVKTEDSQFKLVCSEVDKFPPLDIEEYHIKSSPLLSTSDASCRNFLMYVTAEELHHLISSSKYAISSSEISYHLNGICFQAIKANALPSGYECFDLLDSSSNKTTSHYDVEQVESFLLAVSTDTHRLATAAIPIQEGSLEVKEVIVPRKTVTELLKLTEGMEKQEKIDISMHERKIIFSTADVVIVSKLISSEFPSYREILKERYDKIVIVSRKGMIAAIDIVTSVIDDRMKPCQVSFSEDNVEISVESQIHTKGSGVKNIKSRTNGNIKFTIILNSRYVLDALNVIEEEQVEILMRDIESAIIIRGAGNQYSIHMIMPMQP
ncbi:DNA polymerase III subunit beta [Candidatus Fokinia crypta]|uniref:Beta sliding clamp n=1 Tax=Candidatus Fokinia crypta TaxID=1920990 RepID=A0ABZ0UPD6_9RICK|nr:DNA polymerase III subunit beta [Candidatus Fokinia cryptica]WPX97990.1 DNA polymerase III subunit beta [Candidatus Fokinia cryptica]